jgi:peptidoglycan hydrolase CwlO-like protein
MLLHIVILISVILISLIFKYYIFKYQFLKSNILEGLTPLIQGVNTIPITDKIENNQKKIIDLDDQIIQIQNELSHGNIILDKKNEVLNTLSDNFTKSQSEITNLSHFYSFLPDKGNFKNIQIQNLLEGIQTQLLTENALNNIEDIN